MARVEQPGDSHDGVTLDTPKQKKVRSFPDRGTNGTSGRNLVKRGDTRSPKPKKRSHLFFTGKEYGKKYGKRIWENKRVFIL